MDEFQIVKKIGKGSFGIVYLAANEKNENVAIKRYNKETNEDTVREAIDIGIKLKHPNLMKIYSFFYDRFISEENELSGKSSVHLFTVLEYVPGLNLLNIVEKSFIDNKMFTMPDKLDLYLPGIISGLKYLHNYKIVHRDIKPENIIINNDVPKIIDFDFLADSRKIIKERFGTPFFTSPEIYLNHYDEKTDIWSLGITIYFCLKNDYPFMASNRENLKKLVLSNYVPIYDNISFKYIIILKGLLTKDPIERMSLDRILEILNL